MAKIQGNFNWNKPEVYTSFVQGTDALAIYNALEGSMKNGISYDADSKTLVGSNVFAAAKIDSLLMPLGIRVANLKDLSRPEVIQMVKGKYYTDAPTLVLRSRDDSYDKNLPLIEQLKGLVEQANGRLKLPVMITGFDVKVVENDKGYGIALVPRDDFKAVSDERLKGDFNGKTFSEVDELGLPKFDSKGKRIWYARIAGLSGLSLSRLLNAYSNNENLANSNGNGRIAQNIFRLGFILLPWLKHTIIFTIKSYLLKI